MISCPITQLPLENFYKYVFRAIKDRLGNDKTFDVNDFMEKLFEESVKNADPETAAKWLQSTPRVINLIITKSFSNKIPLVKGLENIYGLMDDFSKPNGEGFQNVLKKYIKPVDTKDLKGEAGHQLLLEFSDEEEEGPEDEKKETNPRVEARLKTPVVMSGTLQSFVPVDPSRKTDTYSERLDKPRAQILTNLATLGDALSMQDPFDGEFTYQGKKVKVKATNLYAFAQQNFNDLDPTTQQEIKDSNFYTSTGRNQQGVTQIDKRVILVITDDAGQNLYFDTEGNLTTKGNGTLVYQFMRDVRQTSKGYSVTDIYGREEQLMPADTYAQLTYNEKIDGDYPTYLEKVKDDREKELKRLFQIRESALANDMMLEFSGLSAGVTSDLTATKLPLSDFLKIPGATKKNLKGIRTLKKAEGNFGKGRAVINLNGTDFQVNRSSMPDSVADQIAAVMFDPNIPFETKKDFYSQFIPEDSETMLAYTMRKHEIIPDMVKQSFRIKIYDKVGDKYGFVTEPIFDFVISKAVLDKSSKETLEKGIKTFSDTLKTGRANGKATYMSYKSDLLNNEEYLTYNSNTKQIEVANYIDFLSTLDGYVDLFNGDPGFYNKHLLFNEENKVEKEIKKASGAASQTFEEALEESIKLAAERKALEDANKSPIEIEAKVIADRALSPEFRAQLAQQGMEGKYDTYYYAASLIQAINTNISQRYTREAAEQLRDIFAGARYINGKQVDTINDIINRAFPKAEGPLQREVEIIQKTIEPEMPDPTTINPSPKKGSLRSRAPKNDSLNREGYMADEIGEEDTAKVLDWWNNTELGKELQKHIELQHAFNLVNSDVFARFVVTGATLANPDIKGKIQINKGIGTLVDTYHEAWHGFTQLFLTRKEKYGLYDEVINYKDASGKQPYKSMDYKAVDELLAEDFRTYMKSNYIKKGSPLRNKLFRKIMNFIRSLFGKKAINPTEVITDVMNVPAVRELFEKLNYSSNKKSFVRSYKANMDNVDFMMLNRGISKLNRPSDSALSDQDSRLVSDTMDMIISDFVDDWYRERVEEAEETGNYNSLKSGTIGLLIDPEHRALMYEVIKERLQDKLDEFKEQLHSQEGITPFSQIEALESSDPNKKTIESEAVAVLRSAKGEDKYVFLKSQIDGFDNLNANMRRGTRVRGESWHGIKIVGDFYSHKSIKKGKKPVGIIVVSSLEDAQVQFDNYVAGGAEEYTDFEVKDVPDYMLSAEQEFTLDNVRILQAAVDNFGDPQWDLKGIDATGTIAYHLENSDFDLSKKKYDIDVFEVDENGDEIDEDQENETHDSETLQGGELANKKSLMQLADKEVIYILKSLHKVDRNGNVGYNRLGFKERADFKKVWNIITKAIGGVRDRVKVYETLMAEAENFPEIAQLIETKFPDPRLITNTFEQDVSNSFWQTFAKPSVKYWQFTVFPQYEPGTNFLTGQTEDILKGFEADVTQSSIEVDSTIRKFESIFKSSIANDYIEKNADNQSTLKLDEVIKAFENKKYPGQLDTSKAFEFAAALGMKLDALPVIKKNIEDRAEYYGLPYIYDIIKDFAGIQKSNKSTEQQLEYLNKFVSNPVGTLRGEIPKGILKSFKKEVAEKNILKRIAELQSQYGYDSANPGILLPDGNRVFENVNHSQVTVTVDAINNVENLSDFWSKPELGYMSHLKPGKSFFTLRSKVLGAMFDTAQGTFDRKGTRSLELLQTAGTQIADIEGVNTSDLDKLGKFFQEFHTMTLSGIAEFIRHAEKKSAFGIKLIGGKMKVIVNGITNGVDQNLYIDINKFVTKPGDKISDGEIVAVGGYFLDYIAAEFDRIRYFKQNPQDLKSIKGYNREIKDENDKVIGMAGEFFSAFDNILRDKTKKDLYALASDPLIDLPTHIRNNQGLYLQIQKDIADYFTEKTESMYNDYFKDLPYVDSKVYEKAGIETKGDISDESKKAVLKSYLFNDWIHKFEMFSLFNGDLSQFNHDKQQASKRAPGSTSDGDGFVNDKYMHEFINKVFNKNTYAKKLAKETGLDLDKFVMNGTLNTGVIADAERKSIYLDEMLESWKEQYTAALTPLYTDKTALKKEIDRRLAKDAKAYKKMVESDGAAFMTFDAYRTLKKQGKSWTIPQEALYQQIIAGEQIDPLKVKEFFPIYKLHYYGSIANAPIATTGMHKFAVAPIIPTIAVKGTELYNLHVKMMKENLQYVTFGSGSKVATLTMTGEFDNIFGDETQKTVSADAPIRKNVIYLEYLKDVTKVASKLKKEISYPTQKRVLLLDGLFNVGDVINKANAEIANNYKASVNDYTETLALDLLNKIGYEYDPKTKKYVGKLDKFIELIRDELGAKEVPEHLIKLLDTTLSDQLSMDFSIHPEADMLEKVIVNRIQKSIIKQKTKGESMVQAPSTFYNGVWDSAFQRDEAIAKNDDLIRKYLGSNNLPFYSTSFDKDGNRIATTAMKVAIPMNGDFLHILKLKHPDGELIGTTDRLNDLIKNDAWLDENRELVTIVGPRIPTDAANSMEFAEVWHFLDASAGNTVIVPTEIVAKAGSDFDVDKIFFMLPNINSDGTLTKAPAENLEQLTKMVKEANSVSKKVRKEKGLPNPQALIDQYKKAAQNKLIKSTRDILSLPDNHASLTKPNNTYLVEDEVEFYDKYSRGYNNKKNAHGEPVRMNGLNDDKSPKEVMSPSRSLDNDYNLNQHEAMLSGNMPLGIMAKKNKVHALFKSVGAVMPLSYNATVWNDETKKYDEIPAQYDVVVRMKHNKTMSGAVSLSNQNNVDGEKIGDIFSHGLQGLLDRANNPFPFKLQIVKEALGTINHLIEAGVSVPEVFAFISNPWIVDYIQKQMYYGGSMAKLQDAPVASHQVKSTAFRETVASLVSAGGEEMKKIVNQVANYANDRRMMDIADMLKQKDQDKVYIIKTKDAEGEEVLRKATGKRIFHSNDFPVDQIIELKEFEENTDYDSLKTLFKRSGGIANNDNFYYASEALWNRAFPGSSTVSKDTLQSLVMGGHKPSIENLAVLMHMLQLEKQFKGMDELEMAFSPDTGLMDTTLQIKKRDDAFKLFDETSKIDSNFLKRLRNNSILSSFYKSGLIMDLVVPLFPLRLNETISKFVEKKIDQTRDMIVQKFGPGVKGKERFINMYNNAVVNYIFQNTMSNSPDEDVKINLEQARKDFDARIFLSSNNTPEGNRAKNLDTFDTAENPFPNFASYVKFVVEKEYLKTVNTKESLAKNKDFKKLSFQAGSEDLGYDKYITQMALMNSFNRAFIMGTTKYSYTGMVMDIINEFEDQNIKDNFPVLAQLAPAKFTKDVNVLELNDKATAKGAIADDYYKNLKQLADPTVRKVVSTDKEMQKIDNNRITEVFKKFSMLMYYQHGTGYSKLGFVKVLDPEAFTKIMQNAANSFLNNDLSEKTLERIYNRLNAKSQFKNYTVDPNNMDEEESVEDYLSTFSEEDFGDMSDFLEGVPTQPSTQNQPTGLSTYTNHSGGAYGGDTFWDIIGREYGVTDQRHYKDAGNANLSQKLRNAGVQATILTKEQMDKARTEVERLLGENYPDTLQGNLQVRNYYQVANADAVFAVATIVPTTSPAVLGGTNTAVQLGIKMGKPVYVFDLDTKKWYTQDLDFLANGFDKTKHEWNYNGWLEIDTPTLTKNFAGVGSRDIESYNVQKEGKWVPREQYKGPEVEAAAKQAIRDVYENTLNQFEQLPVETVDAAPNAMISEFYNGLTEAQKKILGNLEDLIAEYDEIPFDYSEEKYIESLICKL